jgi:hypothetical protein
MTGQERASRVSGKMWLLGGSNFPTVWWLSEILRSMLYDDCNKDERGRSEWSARHRRRLQFLPEEMGALTVLIDGFSGLVGHKHVAHEHVAACAGVRGKKT